MVSVGCEYPSTSESQVYQMHAWAWGGSAGIILGVGFISLGAALSLVRMDNCEELPLHPWRQAVAQPAGRCDMRSSRAANLQLVHLLRNCQRGHLRSLCVMWIEVKFESWICPYVSYISDINSDNHLSFQQFPDSQVQLYLL